MNDSILNPVNRHKGVAQLAGATFILVLALVLPRLGIAQDGEDEEATSCEVQAIALRNACGSDVSDDLWESRAICENDPDEGEREACAEEADDEYAENRQLCRDQLEARNDLCEELDEDRYFIELDPADFVADPLMIGSGVTPNPYFPLIPGNRWVYVSEEDGETITVEVLDETRVIQGITCIVVRDIVVFTDSDEPIEETDDYYAQDLEGNVWYMGEIALNYEDGDLVNIDGSWQAGRDGAQAGIIMFADPQVGTVYRQEYLPAEAEDAGRITSITGSGESEAASCDNDCVITDDFTPIEPDAMEQKVYAPGVGVILEIDPEEGEPVLELIEFETP
jgi:hypothetical protein